MLLREFFGFYLPKVPFPGFLGHVRQDIGQFHSPQMKASKSADNFISRFNLEAFLIENIFIMKNLTDSCKTVETSVDPRLSTFHISPLMVIYKLKNAQVKLIPF